MTGLNPCCQKLHPWSLAGCESTQASSQATGEALGECDNVTGVGVGGDGTDKSKIGEGLHNSVGGVEEGVILIDIVLATRGPSPLTGVPRRITCRYAVLR